MRGPATRRREGRSQSVRTLIYPLIARQRGRLIRLSLAAILGGFAEAAVLVLIARIAFALTSSGSDVRVHLGPLGTVSVSIGWLIAIAAALVLVRVALQAAYTILGARASCTVVEEERRSLLGLYLSAGWPLQAAQREGRLQELLTTYVSQAASAVGSFAQVITNAFNLGALLVTALWVSPVASLSAALAALGIGLLLRPIRAAVRRRSARTAAANLDFATGITELASTLQEVRIFGVEAPVEERLDELNRRYANSWLRTSYAGGSVGVLYQGAALLFLVGALGLAYAAGFNRLSSLGAVVLIMLRSLSYAQGFQQTLQAVHQSAPYVEVLNQEAKRYHSSAMAHGGEPVHRIGTLAFDEVSFEYEAGVPVLRDISFEVRPGEIVGIVGPSGSGKSTLVQLLLRLREPTAGTFLADGRDARRLSLVDWYQHVTFVPQDPHLFAGTVADNIRFFRPSIDDAAIERSAKLAHVHDDIQAWPQGYATYVGERGGQLSGGQRQRLCIARALVEEPEVMVLDEPTSALDVRSESLIRETIADLRPDTTVFIIAHRLSTLAICDRIMVILNGVMEGFDEPSSLEASNPFYREALRLSGMRS
jgi:ABC-type multidrug transport system fused ATPase/permease subunit